MSNYTSANLDNRVTKITESNNIEVTGSNSTTESLDTDFIKSALNSTTSLSDEISNSSINTMKEISNNATTAFYSTSETSNNILDNLSSFEASDYYGENASSVDDTVSGLKNTLSGVVDASSNFLQSLTDSTSLSEAVKKLAEFLVCPESSLLSDIENAASSILDGITEKADDLLSDALESLTESILEEIPGKNSLQDFADSLSSYLGTDNSDLSYAVKLIKDILSSNGKDSSYFSNLSQFKDLANLLDNSDDEDSISSYESNYGSIDSNTKQTLSTLNDSDVSLPTSLSSTKCSPLAKLIEQLEAAYRTDNIFSDLAPDFNTTSNITDSEIFRLLNEYYDTASKLAEYEKESGVHDSNGYNSETTISSSLSLAMENINVLNNLINELDQVNGDPDALQAAIINVKTDLAYLVDINNTLLQKLYSFDSGLDNIQRQNNYYSNSLENIV